MPKMIDAAPGAPVPPRVLQDVAAMFALLSAPVRLHLLWLLGHNERDVGTLAEYTGQSVATVSHHLGKLRLAGLVRDRRHGKRRVYVVTDRDVVELVNQALGVRLDPPASPATRRRRA